MLSIKIEALRFLYRFSNKLNYENLRHYIHNHTKIKIKSYQEDPELIKEIIPDENTPGFIFYGNQTCYIFIDENNSETEQTETLLHEFCHFIKHSYRLSYLEQPVKRNELEAENFVYYVARYHKVCYPLFRFIKHFFCWLGWALLIFLLWYMSQSSKNAVSTTTTVPTTSSVKVSESKRTESDSENITANITETIPNDTVVYVTPTGKKYHRADCQYVNPNTATELTIEEAQNEYSPCKRCDPDNS